MSLLPTSLNPLRLQSPSPQTPKPLPQSNLRPHHHRPIRTLTTLFALTLVAAPTISISNHGIIIIDSSVHTPTVSPMLVLSPSSSPEIAPIQLLWAPRTQTQQRSSFAKDTHVLHLSTISLHFPTSQDHHGLPCCPIPP
ncbi:hypothetical protein M0R45_004923 [Rubus argutus]|uniref:Uncharacterized protein n=1 Tax=Rubus argutus TaxID=59490 RepID=A0AAW1YLR1_RUBAR